MIKYFLGICVLSLPGIACKMKPGEGEQLSGTGNTTSFTLKLNPASGSQYQYDITNRSQVNLEMDGNELNNNSESNIAVHYAIEKDSVGNYLLNMQYDKIQMHITKNKQETVLDADAATTSLDPVERLLGVLKQAQITATISPSGEMKSVSGYNELSQKILAAINAPDMDTRNIAQTRWEQMIEQGIIRKNIEQLFGIFPDSAVQVGDTWSLTHQQKGEINLNVTSNYKLKKIKDGLAIISSEGKLSNDQAPINIMGVNVSGNLEGEQEGEYEIDTETGMMLNSHIVVNIKGELQFMGRNVPISIKNTVDMKGRKIK